MKDNRPLLLFTTLLLLTLTIYTTEHTQTTIHGTVESIRQGRDHITITLKEDTTTYVLFTRELFLPIHKGDNVTLTLQDNIIHTITKKAE